MRHLSAGFLLAWTALWVQAAEVSPSPSASQEIDWASQLPATPEKPLVVTHCSGCHTLEKIVMQRRSLDEWMAVVGKMVGDQGAPISEPEFTAIVEYLGEYYGPVREHITDSGPSLRPAVYPTVDWGALLPGGTGKQQVLSYCSGCHGLNIIVQARKSRDAWFNTVTWMADALEAAIPEDQISVVVDYLATHAGEDNPLTGLPLDVNRAPESFLRRLPFLAPAGTERLLEYRRKQDLLSLEEVSDVLNLTPAESKILPLYLSVN